MMTFPAIWLLVTIPLAANEFTTPISYLEVFADEASCVHRMATIFPALGTAVQCKKYEAAR